VDLDHIVADLFITLFVVHFAQLGLLVLKALDHLAHGQAQVFAFFKGVDDLLVERPLPLPDRVVTGQVHQVHVAGVVCVDNQSVNYNEHVSRVVD
jgi:hypothetical protein